jgi:hypothetical protein
MSYDNLNYEFNQSAPRLRAENLYADRDIWHPTATKKFPLSALAWARDGRLWRYCENAGATLALATLNQSSVETANWTYTAQTNTPGVPIAGDKIVTVVTDTALAVHDLIDGIMYVPDGTGEGNMYNIKDNKVSIANTVGPSGYDTILEIADKGGIRTAWEAASDITVFVNKYKDVLIFPTNPTGPCVGVNNVAVPANYFFWAQVKGMCPVLNGNETIVIGDIVCAGANTEGTVGLWDVTVAEGNVVVGIVAKAPVATGDYALIDLSIE